MVLYALAERSPALLACVIEVYFIVVGGFGRGRLWWALLDLNQ